ncbi:MAG: tRNA (N6-isopentenyl adenosine(37)-C2)-methylthiotransferase MiaB [Lachnospiraceae bacterium]|nr:tRNA (N6-isopentenyl adenosine(37)-C2)-methylthiotransferase MiaB [Lachnospiraceae bacterium]MBR5789674.1 tRNA (N6-isopentenyl adenosine(37)-C2)-methylthiotransferase MiaB [Lachnospiraceae bacterium]
MSKKTIVNPKLYEIIENAPEEEVSRQEYFIEKLRDEVEIREKRLGRKLKCMVNTFGCQMNARDSEKILGILEKAGYEEAEDEKHADFVIYNTCTVRENANNKVYGRLGYLGSLKKKNPDMIIALCGCMMQEEHVRDKIKESYRYVDLVFGTHNIFKFAELVVNSIYTNKQVMEVWDSTDKIVEELPIVRKYSFKSGINIMFGCNNFCSYCIVPYVRGRERSRKPEDIINEIKTLVNDGVTEIMLLGQNVNSYGKGLDNPISFAELLGQITKIEGLRRIRFMTSHPKDLSDELIEVMASSPKICKHLHLPVQSGSTEILRVMNRKYTKEQYLKLVDKIKAKIPDISLTTDIIVGFPGETEEDFDETIDLVNKVQYDSAFTFIYSKRTGTPAAKMDNQVPEDVVSKRFDRLLKVVQEISSERMKKLTGGTVEVLVEEINSQLEGYVTGRLENNSIVHFKGEHNLIGQYVNVKLDECKGFYYIGSMV